MSKASQKRREQRRRELQGLSGAALEERTQEIRREQLREDPTVQALIGEAVRNYHARMQERVGPALKQRDGFASALGIMVARAGGKVVLTPSELREATRWSLQTLIQPDGHLVMHVIRDAHDLQAAQLREKAAASGLVLP